MLSGPLDQICGLAFVLSLRQTVHNLWTGQASYPQVRAGRVATFHRSSRGALGDRRMPFPTLETAALTGATVRQLNYWRTPRGDRGPLLVPEYREGRTYLYSYRDVVALRMFVYLREKTSLQKIRRAVGELDNLGDQEHLSSYWLAANHDSIILIEPKSYRAQARKYTDLVKRPGQEAISAVMEQILGSFKTENRKVLPFPRPLRRIHSNPDILGGFPVVEGTRVPYDLVSSLVRDGVSPSEVKSFYPSVNAAGALDAERFASYVDQYRIGAAA
jgi:uncharacterized protein (DUF433 family)/DNA-binding transcriptional MerR regulator